MKKLGLEEDRKIITQIFEKARTSGKDEPYKIKLAVPYQQIPKWFKELLSEKTNNKVELLTCSLEANGYFKSRGIKKHFPYLYRWTSGELLLQNHHHKNDFTVHEFKREFTRRIPFGEIGHDGTATFKDHKTCHLKGLWVTEQGEQLPRDFLFGSTAFH